MNRQEFMDSQELKEYREHTRSFSEALRAMLRAKRDARLQHLGREAQEEFGEEGEDEPRAAH